jgi:hypothetical protein
MVGKGVSCYCCIGQVGGAVGGEGGGQRLLLLLLRVMYIVLLLLPLLLLLLVVACICAGLHVLARLQCPCRCLLVLCLFYCV